MEQQSKAYKVWKGENPNLCSKVWARYVQFVDRFLEWKGITNPEDLVTSKKNDMLSDDPRDSRNTEREIMEYYKILITEGTYYFTKSGKRKNVILKPQSAKHFLKTMVSFFKAQGLPIEINMRNFRDPEVEGRSIISRDQIKVAWENFGNNKERNRALLMTAKETGLRCSDLVNLNVENYTTAEIVINKEGEQFKVFSPTLTKKNSVLAIVHLGPESIQAVDTYLKTRTQVNPEDPLFLDDNGNRMAPVTLTMQFDRMCKGIGNNNLGGHSMRKFFITTLEGCGISSNFVKKLCGKKLSRTDAGYIHPEDLGLLTPSYINNYDSLRVFKSLDSETRKKQMEMEKTLELQAETIDATIERLNSVLKLLGEVDPEKLKKAGLKPMKFVDGKIIEG